MSAQEHIIFSARAAASPMCVLPLSKGPQRGFQTLLLQASPPRSFAFTTLDAYRQAGPSAPPHFVVRLFDELAESHSLVLLRGELLSRPIINAAEVRSGLGGGMSTQEVGSRPCTSSDALVFFLSMLLHTLSGSHAAGAGSRPLHRQRLVSPIRLAVQPRSRRVQL
jgi:hypothetical protein